MSVQRSQTRRSVDGAPCGTHESSGKDRRCIGGATAKDKIGDEHAGDGHTGEEDNQHVRRRSHAGAGPVPRRMVLNIS
jgi:hypothetical protein